MSNFDIEKKLCAACKADEFETVKEILAKAKAEGYKIDLNVSYIYGSKGAAGTPLILTGCEYIGKLLIDNGAKVNYKDEERGFTALDSINETIEKTELALNNVKTNNGLKEKEEKKAFLVKYNKFKDFLIKNGAKTYNELNNQ